MDMELMDLRDTLSYESATGRRVLTKVETAIIELVNELFEAAYPGGPGLPIETLKAIGVVLDSVNFCDCCQELKDNKFWDNLYSCCTDCSHCQSLYHDPCCHRTCENMTDKDKRFIESRMNTPEAKKWLKQLGSSKNQRTDYTIEEVRQKISYLPHVQQYEHAIGIAGTQRYLLLMPGFKNV
jgi:hypothetical protein